MRFLVPLAAFIQRLLVDIPCRVDDRELVKVPAKGPLLIVVNHINAIEVPAMLAHLYPRKGTGMSKIEAWNNPIFRLLYWVYEAVPVRRGEADMNAVRLCLERLADDYMLAVAPEGTRSRDGQLQQGRPGVVLIAVKSGVPVQPVAYFGHVDLWQNLKHLKKTPFIMRVGNAFTIDLHGERLNKDLSQTVADEIMYQIAALMPARYRGVYADLSRATERYLKFEPGAGSSLARAAEMDRMDSGV